MHGGSPQGTNQGGNNWGQRGNAGGAGGAGVDPQSYNRPLGFVKAGGSGSAQPGNANAEDGAKPVEVVLDDVQAERERMEKVARDAEVAFRDVRPLSQLPIHL